MGAEQNRVSMKSSLRSAPTGGARIGPADGNQSIEVTVRLRRGSEPSEFPTDAELGAGLPASRAYLTREEFAAKHGARAADLAAIGRFADLNALEVASVDAARRTVMLSGTVAAFGAAFGATLEHYSFEGKTRRCRIGALEIPADLEPIIEGVFGLDTRPQAHTHFRRRIRAKAADVSFTALQVAFAYDFPSGADGGGEAIALVELGGGYREADLDSYFKYWESRRRPSVRSGSMAVQTHPRAAPMGPTAKSNSTSK